MLGLEWLYRVRQEPRRLWKRYLVTNTLFLGLLIRELFLKSPPYLSREPGHAGDPWEPSRNPVDPALRTIGFASEGRTEAASGAESRFSTHQRICVVGLGYTGLPTAAILASRGYDVHGSRSTPT